MFGLAYPTEISFRDLSGITTKNQFISPGIKIQY